MRQGFSRGPGLVGLNFQGVARSECATVAGFEYATGLGGGGRGSGAAFRGVALFKYATVAGFERATGPARRGQGIGWDGLQDPALPPPSPSPDFSPAASPK